jgi:hypothetical protein
MFTMNTRRKMLLAAGALLLPAMMIAKGGEVRLRTALAGAAIGGLTPSGHADYRASDNRSRLNVEVEDVNLPAGTKVSVEVNGATVGTITISAAPIRGGELELNTQDGQLVPKLSSGATVTIRNGEAAILSGAL